MSELINFAPFPFLMKETPNGDGDTSESMTEAFSQLVFDDDPIDDPSVVFSEITGVMSSEPYFYPYIFVMGTCQSAATEAYIIIMILIIIILGNRIQGKLCRVSVVFLAPMF